MGRLIYSLGVSADGYTADRTGDFSWAPPGDEQFAFHIERVAELGGMIMGRKLYEAGLVDEFRMFRCPVVVGGGTPYWPPVVSTIALELVETRTFSGGIVYERYVRRDAAST